MKTPLTVSDVIKRGASHRAQRLTFGEMRSMSTCFWDIESSNLDGDFGIILCAGIKTLGKKGVRIYRIDDSPNYETKRWDDSWVAEQIRNELEQHDVVVHHYGDRFDVPFLNTRLLGHRKPILDSSSQCYVDTWLNIRKRLKLHSNRLASLISYLDTKVSKTGLDGRLWTRAVAGDSVALNSVVKHNLCDVLALEEVCLELAKAYALRYSYVK